jgi:hypothetical protein
MDATYSQTDRRPTVLCDPRGVVAEFQTPHANAPVQGFGGTIPQARQDLKRAHRDLVAFVNDPYPDMEAPPVIISEEERLLLDGEPSSVIVLCSGAV